MRGTRGGRRIGAGILATVLTLAAAVLGAPGAPPAGAATGGPGTGGPTTAPTGVHVVHPVGGPAYLADAVGGQLVLRGENDNALEQYPSSYREAPQLVRADLAEMAALGFTFLRLPVSWSRIMPRPGKLDTTYLARVAQVVGWARAAGIGVLVDMHQDNYSVTTDPGPHEADGAPAWAVVDGGTPCTPEVSTTACSLAAFAHFWADAPVHGTPLQTWYLRAMTAVARAAGAGRSSSNVVGVELMNEPWPGGPGTFETTSLYPFYERMVAGLRRAGIVAPIWFEPAITRNVTNDARAGAVPFSTDDDLVYAVHIYTGVFSSPSGPVASVPALATSYANAAAEAATFRAPFVVDEFGSSATPAWNGWLSAQLALQNRYGAGSAFWLWKQRAGRWDNWATVLLDGNLRATTLRAQLLGQPHVDRVPGALVSSTASPERLTATVSGPGGTATLWGGVVVSRGGRTLTHRPLTHVTVDGRATAAACRTVGFATDGVALHGCVLRVRVPAGEHRVVATP